MITGYAQPLTANPGDRVEFMVSTTAARCRYEIVRLLYGDTRDGREVEVEPVSSLAGEFPGTVQETHPGSYAVMNSSWNGPASSALTISALIYPTLTDAGRHQVILATLDASGDEGTDDAVCLLLDEEGRLAIRCKTVQVARPATCTAPPPLTPRMWYRVCGVADADAGRLAVSATPLRPDPIAPDIWAEEVSDAQLVLGVPRTICIAAQLQRRGEAEWPMSCFNGKVEAPQLLSTAADERAMSSGRLVVPPTDDQVIASWDFADGIDTQSIRDLSRHERHGRLFNGPARAVTGHCWDGSVLDFKRAPEQYAAIHFHEDDLDDARWDSSFVIELPPSLRSGLYAARVQGEGELDHIPLVVGPSPAKSPANVIVLVPTLTYQAYANLQPLQDADIDWEQVTDLGVGVHNLDEFLREHPEFGSSLYDTHSDGAGVMYSSTRRPLLSLRPDYLYPMVHAPRGLGGDLYLIKWLEELGIRYDILSDHELAARGSEALHGVDVILTGGHPEYWTLEMLNAVEGFLEAGGRMVYLGGNGFYWVTTIDPVRPHVAEVRRGVAGLRTWESDPGEGYHSTTGEPGGLWRYRGRPPNRLVGVGFAAQGWGRKAAGYVRLPESEDDRVAFIFEGIEDEVIGSRGVTLDGASGDEIDRADIDLGTPRHAIVVARSERHSNLYQVVVEDVKVTMPNLGGESDDRVRSDMVYLEYPNGGAVFSVGSICWLGAMAYHDYENSAAAVTENVLRHFMRR